MINNKQGVWPVMLTPFTQQGQVDYAALERLIAWYEERGVTGLFALCQSSEIFYLTLKERVEIASFVKKHAHIPVIASGHISYDVEEQIAELRAIADTGVDALVLISNRLQAQGDAPEIWRRNFEWLLNNLPGELPLGCYECPYPYKRLLTDDELKRMADSGRFQFLKDTCCDIDRIRGRIEICQGTPMKLYNAHSTTLLESLRAGAGGFSGVMANFHPELYVWLCSFWEKYPEQAELVQAVMTMTAQIERQLYPVNAKSYLVDQGIFNSNYTRVQSHNLMTSLFWDEVQQMQALVTDVESSLKTLKTPAPHSVSAVRV